MPCYLFTYHTYGSWYPDRPQGYVVRGKGILPSDPVAATEYRSLATHDTAVLNERHQRAIIAQLVEAVDHIQCRLHAIATEDTHVHVLVSRQGERSWQQNRASLKKSMTLRLKREFEDRPWLTQNASRRRVRDRQHF